MPPPTFPILHVDHPWMVKNYPLHDGILHKETSVYPPTSLSCSHGGGHKRFMPAEWTVRIALLGCNLHWKSLHLTLPSIDPGPCSLFRIIHLVPSVLFGRASHDFRRWVFSMSTRDTKDWAWHLLNSTEPLNVRINSILWILGYRILGYLDTHDEEIHVANHSYLPPWQSLKTH